MALGSVPNICCCQKNLYEVDSAWDNLSHSFCTTVYTFKILLRSSTIRIWDPAPLFRADKKQAACDISLAKYNLRQNTCVPSRVVFLFRSTDNERSAKRRRVGG